MVQNVTIKNLFIFSLLPLPWLAGGCFSLQRPYPLPSAQTVVEAMRKRGLQVRTLRAETRMRHQTPQGKIRATVQLMAARGGRIRFDALTPFDTPLLTFVANGPQFALIDARKNHHYHGPASACNLARILGVRLNPDEVITILGGSTPLIPYEQAALSWDSREGTEILSLKSRTMSQTLWLEGSDRRWDLLHSEIKDAQGAVVLDLKNEDYASIGALRLPHKIGIQQPKANAELEINFKQQELNIALAPEAFVLPQANGLPSQYVDCATVIPLN
jgi:outer membrane lipoprotein-sorting protein